MVEIVIIGSDSNTGKLIFEGENDTKDYKGDCQAKNKDEVKWHLKNKCGVKIIVAILVKDSPPADPSDDIWDIYPHKASLSQDWKGKVKNNLPFNLQWHYNIFWIDDVKGAQHKFDPKIIVNSHK
jgi:hypothetical protein